MKSRSRFIWIARLAIFLSATTLVNSKELMHLDSFQDIQEYAEHVTQDIHQVVRYIFSTSHNQHSFENTLKPCIQLFFDLSHHFQVLNEIASSNENCNHAALEATEYLLAYLTEIMDVYNLSSIVKDCSQKILQDPTNRLLEQYIAICFLKNNWQDLIHSSTLITKMHIDSLSHPCLSSNTDDFYPISSNKNSGEFIGGVEYKSGPNGSEWNVYFKGKGEDRDGNYVEGKVEKNNKGETSVDVHAGKKSK